ncbi:MAG: hypothetical protein Kow0092_21330 [Deferrisomatales bacterium]
METPAIERLSGNGRQTRAVGWKTRQTLEALVNSFPLPVVALAADATVQTWNPAAERLFGWKESEVLGRPLPLVPEERQGEFRSLFQRALGGEEFRNLELVRRRKDGSPVHLRATTAPMLAADGSVMGVVAIYEDLTWRKRTEAALHRKVRDLTALYDASRQFLRPSDPQSTLADACRLAVEGFGLELAWVGRMLPDEESLEVVALWGPRGGAECAFPPVPCPPGDRDPVARAVRTRRPEAGESAANAIFRELLGGANRMLGAPEAAALPILTRDQVLGVLGAFSLHPGYFTAERLQALQSFANLTAMAFEAATLRERTVRHAAELELRVVERTSDLERFIVAMSGRELRIAELEETVRQLRSQVAGDPSDP